MKNITNSKLKKLTSGFPFMNTITGAEEISDCNLKHIITISIDDDIHKNTMFAYEFVMDFQITKITVV